MHHLHMIRGSKNHKEAKNYNVPTCMALWPEF